MGVVQNMLVLPETQNSVLREPFRKPIDPYTIRSRRVAEFGRKRAACAKPVLWTESQALSGLRSGACVGLAKEGG